MGRTLSRTFDPSPMACNCNQYPDLDEGAALQKRCSQTKKTLGLLQLLSLHESGEHKLYRCAKCGQLWQRSLAWALGNREYLFKVPQIDSEAWLARPFFPPDELFLRSGSVGLYLERAQFVEQEALCRSAGCPEHSIKFSVFCALHHMQNLGIKTGPPGDYRWFGPYLEENFSVTMKQLKALPNYTSWNEQ